MKKISMIVLLTGIIVSLIGDNYSWAEKKPPCTDEMQTMFNKKDTDGDGKISQKEYMEYSKQRAEEKFTRMDSNEDGFISSEEYKQAKMEKKNKGK
jgi:Ca2+-binding EF-hand superfamily protein